MIYQQTPGHPMTDIALRQAVGMVVDPTAWNQAAYGGFGTISTSWLTPDGQCFDSATKNLAPTYNIVKAQQVLTQAGYTTGSDGKLKDKSGNPVSLLVTTCPRQESAHRCAIESDSGVSTATGQIGLPRAQTH